MSFESYFVECLTCGSRLRVSDPAIIGTIASCPKCGAMVQVGPPAQGQPVGEPTKQVAIGHSNVDSEEITRDAYSASDLDASGSTPPMGDERTNIAVPPSAAFQGSESIEPESFDDSAAPPAPDAWQSDRIRKNRQFALIVAVSAATFVMAVVVFVWFVRSRGNVKTSVTIPPPAVETTVDSANLASENAEPAKPETEPDTPEPESESTPDILSPETSEQSAGEPTQQGVTADQPAIPRDLMPVDPLAEPAPTVLQAIAPDEPAAPTDNENPSPDFQQIPEGLAPFLQLLDLGGEANEVTPTIDAPPSLDRAKLEQAAEETLDPMMIATPPPTINAKRVLSVEFAVDTQGYPFNDFVLLISQITGVPVQIDWVEMDITGVDVAAPIVVQQGFLSAQKHLENLCESIAGKMEIGESLIVLTPRDEVFAARLNELTTLDDFGDDAGEIQSLLNTFMAVGDEDQDAPADGLRIPTTRPEQQQLMLAVDTFRRLRGVEPKIEPDTFSRWAYLATSPQAEWPILTGGDSGPPLDAPITIAGLLRRVARKNHATSVVNWFDVNRRRLSPEQLMMPYAKDDAGEMFKRALGPFEVQVRVVDAKHWWVGTEASYDRLPTLVWTEPLGDEREPFMARINETMAGSTSDEFRLVYDKQSDRAIMILPRFVVRQISKIISP